MPRYCPRCGRPKDTDHHDFRPENIVDRWACRVRAVAHTFANDLKTGKRKVVTTYVPDDMQRTNQNDARYVPLEIIKARAASQ